MESSTGAARAARGTRQSRICEYFGPGPGLGPRVARCSHLRSFLCLPPAVRHRIYGDAGLVTDDDVDLNRRRPDGGADSWPSSEDFQLTCNLLLTCRTIYAEVSSSIYSTNRFFIRYRDSRSLQPLRNLRASSLASLTHLTVHLNVSSCEVDQPCCNIYREKPQCWHRHDKLLTTSLPRHQAILVEWQSAASHIKAHINSSRLQLHFVCDVADFEAATLAIEPLISTPTLAVCSIRLGRHPEPALQDLARQTATRAAGYSLDGPETPFRILDLPQELRRQILEYTDLVTPLREVEWNPEEGFYAHYSAWRCGGTWDCPPEMHFACQSRNCWQYSNVGCFCRRHHSAYSLECNCWSPPTSLFLVCRALQEDVQAVFFRKNRFVVTPSKGCNRVADGTPARLEISIFLTEVVPRNALGFLTFLEVVFPPFDEDYLRPHEPAYQDWLETIDYVRDKLCLPTLTLRVYMEDHYPSGQDVTLFRSNMTREQGRTIIAMYARTLRPLSKLNGMSRFFAHLVWPFAWTRAGRRGRQEKPEFEEEQTAMMEQRVEKIVMGDGYDSGLLEKNKQGDSQWLEAALASIMYSG